MLNPTESQDRRSGWHPMDQELLSTNEFTNTLRKWHRSDIVPEVHKQGERLVNAAQSDWLEVDLGSKVWCRHALLVTSPTRIGVAWATSWVVFPRVSEVEQEKIKAGDIPLGDILGVSELRRTVIEWRLSTPIPYPGNVLLMRPDFRDRATSRTTTVSGETGVLAAFTEYWFPFVSVAS